MYFTDILDI